LKRESELERDNRLIIIEYQEFHWLIIQVVEERCHILDHIK